MSANLPSCVIVGRLAEKRVPLVLSFLGKFLKIVNQRDADVWPKCADETEKSLVGTLIILTHHVRHSGKLRVFHVSCQRLDVRPRSDPASDERWERNAFSFSEAQACLAHTKRGLLPSFIRKAAAHHGVEAGAQGAVMLEEHVFRYAVPVETEMIDEGAHISAKTRQNELSGSVVDFKQGTPFVVNLVQHVTHGFSECIATTERSPQRQSRFRII